MRISQFQNEHLMNTQQGWSDRNGYDILASLQNRVRIVFQQMCEVCRDLDPVALLSLEPLIPSEKN